MSDTCTRVIFVRPMLIGCLAFFSLRIWAVWGKRWTPFLVVLVISLIPAWLNIVRLSVVALICISRFQPWL